MKRLFIITLILGITSAFQATPCKAGETVRVFAAASLTGALGEIAALYENHHGTRISTVFASSSTLAKQVINGAPADIYISANEGWMDQVEKSGLLISTSRRNLLANRLSLIAPSTQPDITVDLSGRNTILQALNGGRLAMGDPDHVPAGMYGKAALTTLGQWQSLKDHVAAASDVRAALAFVERGEVTLGIVYASDVVNRPKVFEVLKFPQSSHPPIVYPVAMIRGKRSQSAQQFFGFLQSDEARVIFVRYGFSKP